MAGTKKCYKPKQATVATLTSGAVISNKALSTENWGLALVYGIARNPASAILSNAAVMLWTTGVSAGGQSAGNAYAVTFTDANGRYGVTVATGIGYNLKVYGGTTA